ncbi:hypothetical protein RRG08_043997 [Elysia crispata]|uniref:Uncharacterized protein n=1 Tax=Elysia crispata TaxID=231223 RepID=A0AAE0Y1A1_9GAST|nr:hypothetical protein RRG08_043997 [Elysia crispata]
MSETRRTTLGNLPARMICMMFANRSHSICCGLSRLGTNGKATTVNPKSGFSSWNTPGQNDEMGPSYLCRYFPHIMSTHRDVWIYPCPAGVSLLATILWRYILAGSTCRILQYNLRIVDMRMNGCLHTSRAS